MAAGDGVMGLPRGCEALRGGMFQARQATVTLRMKEARNNKGVDGSRQVNCDGWEREQRPL